MSKVFLPAAVAGIVAAAVSYGTAKWAKPPQQLVTISAPQVAWQTLDANPAKARRIALTTWPEMEQAEVDKLTSLVKAQPGDVTIFCVDDSKCGDLALNLDNVFESAHWHSEVRTTAMLPDGIVASSRFLATAFNEATGDRYSVAVDQQKNAPGEYIAIGARVPPPKR